MLGVLKGLIHRARVVCDKKEDLLEELELLKNVFISNGYPEKLVLKTFKESWAKETLKAVLVGIEQDVVIEEQRKDYVEVLHAPYVKGFTEGLQRKLKKLNVGVIPKKGEQTEAKARYGGQKGPCVLGTMWYMRCSVCGGNRTALLR